MGTALHGVALASEDGAPLPAFEVFVSTEPPWDDFYEYTVEWIVRRRTGPPAYWRPEPLEPVGDPIAVANQEGRFEVPAASTRMAVTVRAAGFSDETLIIEPGALLPRTVRFELHRELSAEISLVDRDSGQPFVAFCEGYVEVAVPGSDPEPSGCLLRQFEQRGSRIPLTVRKGQRWAIAAHAGGYENAVGFFTIEASEQHHPIALTPVLSISGVVTDTTGKPLEDVLVTAHLASWVFMRLPRKGLTAADGTYRVTVREGDVKAFIDHPDYEKEVVEPVPSGTARRRG